MSAVPKTFQAFTVDDVSFFVTERRRGGADVQSGKGSVKEVETPSLKDGEVLLKVEYSAQASRQDLWRTQTDT